MTTIESIGFWVRKLSALGNNAAGSHLKAARIAVFGLVLPFAGCGGPLSLFGILGELGVSEEDLQAYNNAQTTFNDQVKMLPDLNVRIINETNVTAQVSFEVGMKGPQPPTPDVLGEGLFGVGDYLESIDSKAVLVAAGGTVTGGVKCGELISISATAPINGGQFSDGSEDFGLYVSAGNVSFTGLGTGNRDFSGDTVTGVRHVRPMMDGVNCQSSTLIIRIQTIASFNVFDDATGELTVAGAPGTGVIEVE